MAGLNYICEHIPPFFYGNDMGETRVSHIWVKCETLAYNIIKNALFHE